MVIFRSSGLRGVLEDPHLTPPRKICQPGTVAFCRAPASTEAPLPVRWPRWAAEALAVVVRATVLESPASELGCQLLLARSEVVNLIRSQVNRRQGLPAIEQPLPLGGDVAVGRHRAAADEPRPRAFSGHRHRLGLQCCPRSLLGSFGSSFCVTYVSAHFGACCTIDVLNETKRCTRGTFYVQLHPDPLRGLERQPCP